MASYGGYETVRELYRSGLASTFSARKTGESGESRTVKLYQPFLAGDDMAERIESEVASFVDGARTQQKVAGSGARYWSAVHDVAKVPGGAFAIGDYHRRSAQQLIAGRVKLSPGGLYRLVRAVVEGLAELKKTCNRPHGNLKPSNILLTGKSKVNQARPLLTDPIGSDKLDPQVGDVVDFHALGELIYQLVLHRTGKAMGGWPAPDGPEWQRLGKRGEQWRQLCNRLLNPNLAPNLMTFDDLLDDIEKLKATDRSPAMLLIPAAAVVIVAGAAAALFWPGGATEPGEWDPNSAARWKAVCTDFGRWVEPMLSDREEGKLRSWQDDAYLSKNVLPLLDEVVREANPRVIAGQTWGDVFRLGEKPTDQARGPDAVRQTRKAERVYQRLRTALTSDAWPAQVRLQKAAQAFADRGWSKQSDYLRSLETVIDANGAANGVTGRVDAILAVQDDLTRIEAAWGELTQLIAAAQQWEAEVFKDTPAARRARACGLGRLNEYVADKLRAPPVRDGSKGLADLLERLRDLAARDHSLSRLAALVRSEKLKSLDLAFVRHSPPFALGEDGRLTDDILRRGQVSLESKYDLKPDPRTPSWKASVSDSLTARQGDIKAIGEAIAKLIQAEDPPPADRKALDAAAAKMAELGNSAQSARSLVDEINAAATYDFSTRVKIDSDIEAVDARLKSLARGVASVDSDVEAIRKRILRARAATLAEYHKALRERVRVSSTALADVDAAWVKQRDALLASEKTVESLAEKVDRLEKFLGRVENAFEPELSAAGAKLQQRPWNRDLLTRDLDLRRRSAVASALSYADWAKVLAGADLADYQAKLDRLVGNYDKWRKDLAALVPAVNRVQDLMVAGYQLGESPGDAGPTIAEAWNSVQGNSVLADPVGTRVTKPVVDRVTRLRQVASLTDANGLTAVALTGKPASFEAARAAWLTLGGLRPAWPATADDLRREARIRKSLDTLYGLVQDDARKKLLRTELAAESRRRWQACLIAQADPRQIELIVARMADFGVSADDKSLPPMVRYRLAMREFRGQMLQGRDDLDDAAVKAGILAFQNRVKSLSLDASASAELASLVKALEGLRQAKQTAIDLTKAGPGGAGWAMTGQTANTVTYAWTGRDQKLTFARVAPAGGEPCFLCTTEVSLGLFIEVVLGLQKWTQMSEALPGEIDEPRGPRGWVRAGGSIRIDPNWFPVIPPTLEGKLYARGLRVDVPTALHPVQQVPLPAAVYFARLINCRLPTAAEWQAAHEQDKASGSTTPYNLRDRTWLAQRDHDVALEDSGDLLDADLFYPDAGIFWPGSIAVAQRKTQRDAEAWPNAPDDGSLWPGKVVSDNRRLFQHLVGNVAEYVYEDSKSLTALKDPTVAQVRTLLTAGVANAKVIGGSAMSAPQTAVDKPHALGAAAATKQGYSDVGFRLAFLAGRERLQTTLQKLLGARKHEGYLSPAAK